MKELRTLKQMIEERRPTDRPMVIAVDFDGTLCTNKYPKIGEPNRLLIELLREEQIEHETEIILWSCRTGSDLEFAYAWLWTRLKSFDYTPKVYKNENPSKSIDLFGGDSRKVFADFYIDDRSMEYDILWGEEEIVDDTPISDLEIKEVTEQDIKEAKNILVWDEHSNPIGVVLWPLFLRKFGLRGANIKIARNEKEALNAFYGDNCFNPFEEVLIILDRDVVFPKNSLNLPKCTIEIRRFTY